MRSIVFVFQRRGVLSIVINLAIFEWYANIIELPCRGLDWDVFWGTIRIVSIVIAFV